VRPDDATGLARAIRELASNPRELAAMGCRARAAAAEFTRDGQIAAHASLLGSLATAHR
jgi:glycosyltransferase involved in cell wall biosynthesis